MYKKVVIFLLTIVLLILNLAGCKKKVLDDSFFALDTIISIKIYDYKDKNKAIDYLTFCKNTIMLYEDKFSRKKETSDVYLYNHDLRKEEELDDSIKDILYQVKEFNENVTPYFDVYLGNIIEIWDVAKNNNVVANQMDIIVAYAEKKKLDLGGVAKGYIADILAKETIKYDIKSCIINLGGNVYVVGDKNKKDFNVGIAKPFSDEEGEIMDTINCKNTSVVTSGIYQRYYKVDGDDTIYHHIIDGKTGFPVKSDIISATIVCENSTLADMLSTSCVLVGKKGFEDIIDKAREHYDINIDVVIIDNNYEIIKY